jgi:acetate kinase
MRKLVCTDMDYFGIHLDEAKMKFDQKNYAKLIHSRTKILVIPTNEEK